MSKLSDNISGGLVSIPSGDFDPLTMVDVTSDFPSLSQYNWKKSFPISVGRKGHSISVVGTDIYVIGGNTIGTNIARTDVQKFDTLTNTWSTMTPLGWGKTQHSVTVVGTDIYLYGGTNNGSASNAIYKFNTLTNTWSSGTTLVTILSTNGGMCTVGTTIYYYGGGVGTSVTNQLWSFDTQLAFGTPWTQLTPTGTVVPPRSDHSMVSIGTDIYIFGGWDGTTYYGQLYKYDTLTNVFSGVPGYGLARSGHSAAVVGTNMYIFGGWDGTRYYNDLAVFDSISVTWSSANQNRSINNRKDMVMDSVGSEIFIVGGEGDHISNNNTSYYDDLYRMSVIQSPQKIVVRRA